MIWYYVLSTLLVDRLTSPIRSGDGHMLSPLYGKMDTEFVVTPELYCEMFIEKCIL